MEEYKDNLDRKEYLLQFNEQKYHQYEKVLRDLILSKDTPDIVKDQLRIKIETQELFVPKDERKITSVVCKNQELDLELELLKQENITMRNQLEEIVERGKLFKDKSKMADGDKFINNMMNNTIELLSIFQNKEVGEFRNIDLEHMQKDHMYVQRLQLSIENLNSKLTRLKDKNA